MTTRSRRTWCSPRELSCRRWNARSRPGLPRTSDRAACTWLTSCRARPPGNSCAATLPFATVRRAARAGLTHPRLPSHFPKRKGLIEVDEIRQFVLDSLTDMNYSIEGVDD